jgi:hypothetical protein
VSGGDMGACIDRCGGVFDWNRRPGQDRRHGVTRQLARRHLLVFGMGGWPGGLRRGGQEKMAWKILPLLRTSSPARWQLWTPLPTRSCSHPCCSSQKCVCRLFQFPLQKRGGWSRRYRSRPRCPARWQLSTASSCGGRSRDGCATDEVFCARCSARGVLHEVFCTRCSARGVLHIGSFCFGRNEVGAALRSYAPGRGLCNSASVCKPPHRQYVVTFACVGDTPLFTVQLVKNCLKCPFTLVP